MCLQARLLAVKYLTQISIAMNWNYTIHKIEQYVNQGYFYKPQADITVADSENVKIRIRALLRDETKTPWVESGTLILSTTQFDFAEPDNSILLGFV